MLDPLLRPVKDRLLAPLASPLGRVHPNWITSAAFAAGLLAAVAGWSGAFGLGLLAWIANRVLDGLDGLVARVHGKASELGGYMDLLVDFAVYAAIPLALALRPGADPALAGASALMLGTFYVNASAWMVLSALLEKRGHGAAARGEPTSVTLPEGLISGSETFVFYAAFFLFPEHLVALFHLMAALVAVTVAQRLVWGIRTL